MNRNISRAACLFVAVPLSLGATGCAASSPAPVVTASPTVTVEPAVDFRTAKCNLGEVWDSEALVKRASYVEPAFPFDGLKEQYGSTLANDSCADADILKWQELRRALGEDDTICRIVWYDDYLTAVTYDIGCAVPMVVIASAVR